MYQKVGGEGGAPLETFPALLALEQLLSAVNGSEQTKYKKTKIPPSPPPPRPIPRTCVGSN